MPNHIIISNFSISLDHEGRINLNQLYRLSGEGKAKQPSNWLRLQTTQELIDELDMQSSDLRTALQVINGGNNRGTYAHELLAISYAGWINAKFQLQVNQAFIDSRRQPLLPDIPADQMLITKDKYIALLERQIEHLEYKPKGKLLSSQEKQRILDLKAQGLTNGAIQRLTGRSDCAIRNVIKEVASC